MTSNVSELGRQLHSTFGSNVATTATWNGLPGPPPGNNSPAPASLKISTSSLDGPLVPSCPYWNEKRWRNVSMLHPMHTSSPDAGLGSRSVSPSCTTRPFVNSCPVVPSNASTHVSNDTSSRAHGISTPISAAHAPPINNVLVGVGTHVADGLALGLALGGAQPDKSEAS